MAARSETLRIHLSPAADSSFRTLRVEPDSTARDLVLALCEKEEYADSPSLYALHDSNTPGVPLSDSTPVATLLAILATGRIIFRRRDDSIETILPIRVYISRVPVRFDGSMAPASVTDKTEERADSFRTIPLRKSATAAELVKIVHERDNLPLPESHYVLFECVQGVERVVEPHELPIVLQRKWPCEELGAEDRFILRQQCDDVQVLRVALEGGAFKTIPVSLAQTVSEIAESLHMRDEIGATRDWILYERRAGTERTIDMDARVGDLVKRWARSDGLVFRERHRVALPVALADGTTTISVDTVANVAAIQDLLQGKVRMSGGKRNVLMFECGGKRECIARSRMARDLHARLADGVTTLVFAADEDPRCEPHPGHFPYRESRIAEIATEWRAQQLAARAESFTSPLPVNIFVGTWNVGNIEVPPAPERLASWIDTRGAAGPPEIVAISLQEIELSAEAFIKSSTSRSSEWVAALSAALATRDDGPYALVATRQLVGMLVCVFVRTEHMRGICDVSTDAIGVGVMKMGNKGAVAVRFQFYGREICFVGAHLAAGQKKVGRRNEDQLEVARRFVFSGSFGKAVGMRQHDLVLWAGDLNYRLDLPRETVEESIRAQNWPSLMQFDQLSLEMTAKRVFVGFQEGVPSFAPTYKYDPGTTVYDTSEKQRIPAWCDRILWCETKCPGIARPVALVTYCRHDELQESDHRPVSAVFDVCCRREDGASKAAVRAHVEMEWDRLRADGLSPGFVKSIEGCPLFPGIDHNFMEELFPRAATEFFKAGDYILRRGMIEEDVMYFISHGTAEVLLGNGETVLLSRGDFFGEGSFLNEAGSGRRTASIRAAPNSDVETLVVTRRLGDELFPRWSEVAAAIKQIGADRLKRYRA